jgi:hypothetical protein
MLAPELKMPVASERAFLLRKIFGCRLDRCREIGRLADRQHGARNHEAGDRQRHRSDADRAEDGGHAGADRQREGVQDGADRPHHDRQHECAAGAEAVDHAAGEQHRNRIHELEHGGDVGVVAVGPVELLRQLRRQQAQYLAVKVVDRRRKK